MIEIDRQQFLTPHDLEEILKLKYTTIILLCKHNKFPKYKGKYYITKEQAEKLKNRENQNVNKLTFEEKMKMRIKKVQNL